MDNARWAYQQKLVQASTIHYYWATGLSASDVCVCADCLDNVWLVRGRYCIQSGEDEYLSGSITPYKQEETLCAWCKQIRVCTFYWVHVNGQFYHRPDPMEGAINGMTATFMGEQYRICAQYATYPVMPQYKLTNEQRSITLVRFQFKLSPEPVYQIVKETETSQRIVVVDDLLNYREAEKACQHEWLTYFPKEADWINRIGWQAKLAQARDGKTFPRFSIKYFQKDAGE